MVRKNLLAVLGFAFCFGAQSQEFQGMAIYQSKTSSAEMQERFKNDKNMTPDRQKQIEERMKSLLEKTFILNFNKSASIYKEEEKLETPGQGSDGRMKMMSAMMGSGGTFYKNVKEKSYTVDKEFMGKAFLVKDSLATLPWKMEGETRVIGGYNCFKATAVVPMNDIDMGNFRPRSEEEKRKEDEAEKENKTNLLSSIKTPTERTVTAWYTPEIPVNQGPDKYWGLPGLILEINDGKTVILCSKIVLNPKEKTVIKAATSGKVIGQKEYDETVEKKTKEYRENNPRQGGGPGGDRGGR